MRSGLDQAVFRSTLIEGSEPEYAIDFRDGTTAKEFGQNSTRRDPSFPDYHYIKHVYYEPNNYTALIAAKNIFASDDDNATVIVQNPLGHKFILVPDAVEPIPFPNGLVTFNSQLTKNMSHSFLPDEDVPNPGWATNVHAHWLLLKPSGNVSKLRSYGDYETGIGGNLFVIACFLSNYSFENSQITLKCFMILTSKHF